MNYCLIHQFDFIQLINNLFCIENCKLTMNEEAFRKISKRIVAFRKYHVIVIKFTEISLAEKN